MKRILRDPHGKDRDLRSACRAGEISRNNSESRLASFPSSRSARERCTESGQGFLGIDVFMDPREYGPMQ